jgi:hypothetical protein
MKKSNFDRLIMRYVTRKTSAGQTGKIEAMLKAIKRRKIHFVSEETEEFLYRKITDRKVSAEQIALIVKGFSKLTVPEINWLRIKPFCVYFHRDCIRGLK